MNPSHRLDSPSGAWAPVSSPYFAPPTAHPTVRPAEAAEVRFGEFRIPAHLDLLYRQTEVVPLEPRAVQVLRALARSGGEVVSKEALLDQVWLHSYVTEGVLKKAVFQIRRALGDGAEGRAWVETYHRRGYRLRLAGPLPAPGERGAAHAAWVRTSA